MLGQGLEGERGAIDEIAEADAVGAEQPHAAFARDGAEPVLLGDSLRAGLGEARGEDDGAAGLAPRAGQRGFDYRSLGHDQDHRIDAERQGVDARHARAAVDFLAIAADEMKLAAIAGAHKVLQHIVADRSRLGRGADDGHRARTQQAPDRRSPLAYSLASFHASTAVPESRVTRFRGTLTEFRGRFNDAGAAGHAMLAAPMQEEADDMPRPRKNGSDAASKAASGGKTVLVDIEDGIAWVTLNRPEKRNAISPQLSSEMLAALDAIEADEQRRRAGADGRGQCLLRRHGPQGILPRHR